ncbi:hypothetical protein M0812_27887 [Anaeramoeba flamelloides]|uniref:Uncharacterized protein n=1 Tax=Anaeramoeba flamelloides TaxID=1746091 RepID=A0AAV7YC33_9EUKA|nr:hypothetical protein M0812_27887 [Anaeramoeba flamelloides]
MVDRSNDKIPCTGCMWICHLKKLNCNHLVTIYKKFSDLTKPIKSNNRMIEENTNGYSRGVKFSQILEYLKQNSTHQNNQKEQYQSETKKEEVEEKEEEYEKEEHFTTQIQIEQQQEQQQIEREREKQKI